MDNESFNSNKILQYNLISDVNRVLARTFLDIDNKQKDIEKERSRKNKRTRFFTDNNNMYCSDGGERSDKKNTMRSSHLSKFTASNVSENRETIERKTKNEENYRCNSLLNSQLSQNSKAKSTETNNASISNNNCNNVNSNGSKQWRPSLEPEIIKEDLIENTTDNYELVEQVSQIFASKSNKNNSINNIINSSVINSRNRNIDNQYTNTNANSNNTISKNNVKKLSDLNLIRKESKSNKSIASCSSKKSVKSKKSNFSSLTFKHSQIQQNQLNQQKLSKFNEEKDKEKEEGNSDKIKPIMRVKSNLSIKNNNNNYNSGNVNNHNNYFNNNLNTGMFNTFSTPQIQRKNNKNKSVLFKEEYLLDKDTKTTVLVTEDDKDEKDNLEKEDDELNKNSNNYNNFKSNKVRFSKITSPSIGLLNRMHSDLEHLEPFTIKKPTLKKLKNADEQEKVHVNQNKFNNDNNLIHPKRKPLSTSNVKDYLHNNMKIINLNSTDFHLSTNSNANFYYDFNNKSNRCNTQTLKKSSTYLKKIDIDFYMDTKEIAEDHTEQLEEFKERVKKSSTRLNKISSSGIEKNIRRRTSQFFRSHKNIKKFQILNNEIREEVMYEMLEQVHLQSDVGKMQSSIKRVDILISVLLCLNLIFSLVDNEIYINKTNSYINNYISSNYVEFITEEVLEQMSNRKISMIENIFRAANSLISVSSFILLIINRCKKYSLDKLTGQKTPQQGMISGFREGIVFSLESIICLFHLPPLFNIVFTGTFLGNYWVYSINAIFSCCCMIKFYFTINLFHAVSKWNSEASYSICRKNHVSPGLIFSIKCEFKNRPFIFLAILFGIFTCLCSFILRTFEFGVKDKDDKTFIGNNPMQAMANCFSFILFTVTKVGYGEMEPRSLLGRVIASIAAIIGNLIIALFIAYIAVITEFTNGEKKAYTIIKKLTAESNLKEKAAIVIKQVFHLRKFGVKKRPTNNGKELNHAEKDVSISKEKRRLSVKSKVAASEGKFFNFSSGNFSELPLDTNNTNNNNSKSKSKFATKEKLPISNPPNKSNGNIPKISIKVDTQTQNQINRNNNESMRNEMFNLPNKKALVSNGANLNNSSNEVSNVSSQISEVDYQNSRVCLNDNFMEKNNLTNSKISLLNKSSSKLKVPSKEQKSCNDSRTKLSKERIFELKEKVKARKKVNSILLSNSSSDDETSERKCSNNNNKSNNVSNIINANNNMPYLNQYNAFSFGNKGNNSNLGKLNNLNNNNNKEITNFDMKKEKSKSNKADKTDKEKTDRLKFQGMTVFNYLKQDNSNIDYDNFQNIDTNSNLIETKTKEMLELENSKSSHEYDFNNKFNLLCNNNKNNKNSNNNNNNENNNNSIHEEADMDNNNDYNNEIKTDYLKNLPHLKNSNLIKLNNRSNLVKISEELKNNSKNNHIMNIMSNKTSGKMHSHISIFLNDLKKNNVVNSTLKITKQFIVLSALKRHVYSFKCDIKAAKSMSMPIDDKLKELDQELVDNLNKLLNSLSQLNTIEQDVRKISSYQMTYKEQIKETLEMQMKISQYIVSNNNSNCNKYALSNNTDNINILKNDFKNYPT